MQFSGSCTARPRTPEVLEVGHAILLSGVPQTLEPFLSYRSADLGRRVDWHEGFDGAVDSRANPVGAAVNQLTGATTINGGPPGAPVERVRV